MPQESVKLWNGWRIFYNGKKTEVSTPKDLWGFFSKKNIEISQENREEITRQLFCWGEIEFKLTNKKLVKIELF